MGLVGGQTIQLGSFHFIQHEHEFVSNPAFPCFSQNIPFFPLKHKKRCLLEKLSCASNIHLQP